MISSISLAISIIILGELFQVSDLTNWAKQTIAHIKFDEVVIRGMLGVLLFAAALHINFSDIYKEKSNKSFQ